jgi:hypothetical protein
MKENEINTLGMLLRKYCGISNEKRLLTFPVIIIVKQSCIRIEKSIFLIILIKTCT